MTSPKACVPCFFLLILMITGVSAFSVGALDESCLNLEPGHGITETQSKPYSIRLRTREVYGGETLDFSIDGTQHFKGFLVKAVLSGTDTNEGKMVEGNNTDIRCKGSGLTHTDGKIPKTTRKGQWRAPMNPKEKTSVQLKAVIVANRSFNFYVNSVNFMVLPTTTPAPRPPRPPPQQVPPHPGPSSNMGVSGRRQSQDSQGRASAPRDSAPTAQRTHEDPIDTMSAQARRQLTQEETKTNHNLKIQLDPACGDSLGCFHDCVGGRCSFIVTWKDNGESISFHMKRIESERSERWMAIGFSDDDYMGDDSVVEAVIDRGIVNVYSSYNTDKTNKRLDDKTAGLENAVGSYVNGILECSFDRVKTDEFYPELKDLNKDVYLMFADGEAITGTLFPHDYTKLPTISPTKVDLKSFANVGGDGPTFPLVRAHAVGTRCEVNVMLSIATWTAILAAV